MLVVVMMLKTKYERMSKEEKKKTLEDYRKTEVGKSMIVRLTRLIVIGILGILYSVFLFVSNFKDLKWTDYLVVVPLFLISIFFIVMSIRLKKKVLNQFAVKKK